MPETWTVTKKKLTGESRSWRARRVGADDHGTWLYAPVGTANRDSSGKLINHLRTAGVQLIPSDGWWVGWWWKDGGITVDIATPVQTGAKSAVYVDLELDLWARGSDYGLVDQDEYDAARVAGLMTDEQDCGARAAADAVQRMLAEHVEPFACVGRNWLERGAAG